MFTDTSNFPSEIVANKKLTNQDIIDLSAQFAILPAALMAVLKVETGGRGGFDNLGRPKILFEGHVFYNQIKGNKELLEDVLKEQKNNICYPSWGARGKAYNLDQYTRLEEAISYDINSALKSASWGLGQIMGLNFKACGSIDIASFVKDMYFSEKKQLQMMLNFIKSSPKMLKALQDLDWAGFALRYNGSGYKQNAYDTKLAQAYTSYIGKIIFI